MPHIPPTTVLNVKPRRPKSHPYLPIIAHTPEGIYLERTDEFPPGSEIDTVVKLEPPSILVARQTDQLLLKFHRRFHSDPLWQFKVSPIEHKRWNPNRQATNVRKTGTLVHFFGWRGKPLPDGPRGGKRHAPNRYHVALDPVRFSPRGLTFDGEITVDMLYCWAADMRRWCYAQGLTLRPTNGALAAQLLRDPRFYPHSRRKVPGATNAKAHEYLPGNHYRLHVPEEREIDAYYLDQVASHHNCARTIKFPHSNHLHAYGHYRTLKDAPGPPVGVLRYPGLFLLKLHVPHMPPGSFPPPWAERQGLHLRAVYSNELPLLRQLHVQIEHVAAAWISLAHDHGLNRFAEWALTELAAADDERKIWLKPTLLATYGLLSATPRKHRVGFAHATGGTKEMYPAGADFLPVIERAAQNPSEPGFANSIHRGMIEAECRQRSLGLARELHSQGFSIAAVYADSIFVKAWQDHVDGLDRQRVALPLLPPGWEIEEICTHLRFHNEVSFTSSQIQKLPGVPKSRRVTHAANFGNNAYAHSLKR